MFVIAGADPSHLKLQVCVSTFDGRQDTLPSFLRRSYEHKDLTHQAAQNCTKPAFSNRGVLTCPGRACLG